MGRNLFIAIVFCMFGGVSQATSVIAIRTPVEIVLGADSKVISGDRSDTRTVCKIGISKDVFWGESGILGIPNEGFSVDSMVSAVVTTGDPINTRISRFEAVIRPALISILTRLKHTDEAYFTTHHEGQSSLEMIFAYFDRNIPHLDLLNFVAKSNAPAGDISLETTRSSSPSNKFPDTMFVALGRHEAVDQEVQRFPTMWTDLGVPWAVRHLIQTEITAIPEEVGPPIAILEIDKTGAQWISKGQCTASH